jgi:hypothetical protein
MGPTIIQLLISRNFPHSSPKNLLANRRHRSSFFFSWSMPAMLPLISQCAPRHRLGTLGLAMTIIKGSEEGDERARRARAGGVGPSLRACATEVVPLRRRPPRNLPDTLQDHHRCMPIYSKVSPSSLVLWLPLSTSTLTPSPSPLVHVWAVSPRVTRTCRFGRTGKERGYGGKGTLTPPPLFSYLFPGAAVSATVPLYLPFFTYGTGYTSYWRQPKGMFVLVSHLTFLAEKLKAGINS